jgi:hypothetical protein
MKGFHKCGFLCILLIIFNAELSAQSGMSQMTGARYNGLAGNGETFQDANALLTNQAGIAFLEKQSLIMAFERQFWLESLSQVSLGFAQPVKNGAFALQLKYYGNEYYQEGKVGIAYARKLAENFAMGAQINYIFIQVEEGGSEGVFTFEGGIQGKILPFMTLGFHVFSPVAVSFSNGYRMPTILRLGSNFELSDNVSVYLGVEKDISFRENYRFGIEYKIIGQVYARCGIQTRPQSVSFGFGLPVLRALNMDFSSSWNQTLGLSSHFSTHYTF